MTESGTEWGALTHRLLAQAAALRQPANGMFELTSRCNLACRMCYVQQPAAAVAARQSELSAESWVSLAEQAVEAGMVFLLLTGGEPFLRPDFFEIYTPLTRMGLILTLFTNGTLITDAIAGRLAATPPNRTEISLYGATAATYEAVTCVPGSYARCCAGIEALLAHKVPLALKTTLTRQNVGELEAMRAMARAWGVPFSAAWLLTPRRDGGASDLTNCRLSVQEYVALEASDEASATEMTEAVLRAPSSADDGGFYCLAGKSAFVIGPSGEMGVCIDLPLPAAKPLEIGFRAAWQQVQDVVDSTPPAPECHVCDLRAFCGRCPAYSWLETGRLTEKVPYWCEIAAARKERFGTHA